jgi:SAM-dependent methyltransferase
VGSKREAEMTDFSHVADEYDKVGLHYQESKRLAFRRYVEEHSMFTLLGDLAGRSVVDLACGEGIYSRQLIRAGARRVVGVDISPEMIALAEQAEAVEPLGVRYLIADVAAVELDEQFDVALCSYLFNYARTRSELRTLVRSVRRLVRPGGLVVGCNDYPDNPRADFDRYRQYGFIKVGSADRQEGDTVTYRFFNPDGSTFEIDNYFLPSDVYRDEFADAGFASFDWVMPEVSPEGLETFPAGFWEAYLNSPPIVSLTAAADAGGGQALGAVRRAARANSRRAHSAEPRFASPRLPMAPRRPAGAPKPGRNP